MFNINGHVTTYIKKYKWRILRFVFVGATTFFFNMVLIWLFYEKLELNNRISVTSAYLITVLIHFLLNHSFTYRQNLETMTFDFLRYIAMVVLNYLITLSLSIVVVELFGLSIYLGGVFSILITGITSFIIMNHFVFSGKNGKK
jgi:putative flippase GtrA